MKKTAFVWLLILSGVILTSCGKVKEFEFRRLESWNINGLGLDASSISARLVFFNPNTFTVTLKHFEGDVKLEGSDLGTCVADTTVKIAPGYEFILPVNIQLKTGAALMGGLALLGKDSVIVNFKGYARVGRSGFFINYKFDTQNKVSTKF